MIGTPPTAGSAASLLRNWLVPVTWAPNTPTSGPRSGIAYTPQTYNSPIKATTSSEALSKTKSQYGRLTSTGPEPTWGTPYLDPDQTWGNP